MFEIYKENYKEWFNTPDKVITLLGSHIHSVSKQRMLLNGLSKYHLNITIIKLAEILKSDIYHFTTKFWDLYFCLCPFITKF